MRQDSTMNMKRKKPFGRNDKLCPWSALILWGENKWSGVLRILCKYHLMPHAHAHVHVCLLIIGKLKYFKMKTWSYNIVDQNITIKYKYIQVFLFSQHLKKIVRISSCGFIILQERPSPSLSLSPFLLHLKVLLMSKEDRKC